MLFIITLTALLSLCDAFRLGSSRRVVPLGPPVDRLFRDEGPAQPHSIQEIVRTKRHSVQELVRAQPHLVHDMGRPEIHETSRSQAKMDSANSSQLQPAPPAGQGVARTRPAGQEVARTRPASQEVTRTRPAVEENLGVEDEMERMVHLVVPQEAGSYRGPPDSTHPETELLAGPGDGDVSVEASGFYGTDMEDRDRGEEGGEDKERRGGEDRDRGEEGGEDKERRGGEDRDRGEEGGEDKERRGGEDRDRGEEGGEDKERRGGEDELERDIEGDKERREGGNKERREGGDGDRGEEGGEDKERRGGEDRDRGEEGGEDKERRGGEDRDRGEEGGEDKERRGGEDELERDIEGDKERRGGGDKERREGGDKERRGGEDELERDIEGDKERREGGDKERRGGDDELERDIEGDKERRGGGDKERREGGDKERRGGEDELERDIEGDKERRGGGDKERRGGEDELERDIEGDKERRGGGDKERRGGDTRGEEEGTDDATHTSPDLDALIGYSPSVRPSSSNQTSLAPPAEGQDSGLQEHRAPPVLEQAGPSERDLWEAEGEEDGHSSGYGGLHSSITTPPAGGGDAAGTASPETDTGTDFGLLESHTKGAAEDEEDEEAERDEEEEEETGLRGVFTQNSTVAEEGMAPNREPLQPSVEEEEEEEEQEEEATRIRHMAPLTSDQVMCVDWSKLSERGYVVLNTTENLSCEEFRGDQGVRLLKVIERVFARRMNSPEGSWEIYLSKPTHQQHQLLMNVVSEHGVIATTEVLSMLGEIRRMLTQVDIQAFSPPSSCPSRLSPTRSDYGKLFVVLVIIGSVCLLIITSGFIYICWQRRPPSTKTTFRAEELHFVENSCHDNPTLDVTNDNQPQMQEKKPSTNGLVGGGEGGGAESSRWQVFVNQAATEEEEEEQDTHL